MDILTNHWRPIPRRFPARFKVVTIGHPRKTVQDQTRTTFDTLNFSFILAGGGYCLRAGQVVEVQAPSLLIEWPGEPLEYGPTEKYGFWEEFYLIFDRSQVPDFLAAGLLKSGEFLRELGHPALARKWMDEIKQVTQGEATPEKADRLDRLCELLLVDTLPPTLPSETNAVERSVREVYRQVMQSFSKEPDFEKLAQQAGLSYSSFRRHWTSIFGLPPRRSLIRRRAESACELLVNSSLTIAEISEKVGFNDPLYFSRSFHRETGMSASHYRLRYRTP